MRPAKEAKEMVDCLIQKVLKAELNTLDETIEKAIHDREYEVEVPTLSADAKKTLEQFGYMVDPVMDSDDPRDTRWVIGWKNPSEVTILNDSHTENGQCGDSL